MSLPTFRVEWLLAFRRRRLLFFNFGIPLLLVLPLRFGGAPAFHAAAAYAVLFVLFGTFGSAIPLLREGEGGLLRRVVLTGVSQSGFLAQRLLAGTVLDILQLVPAAALILIPHGLTLDTVAMALPALALALLAANLIGVWVAAASRSLAEGALFAAVISLFLLHGSGVFRTPTPGSVGATFQAILPVGPLHQTLLAAAEGRGLAEGPGSLVLPWITALFALAATLVFSGRLLDRISAPLR